LYTKQEGPFFKEFYGEEYKDYLVIVSSPPQDKNNLTSEDISAKYSLIHQANISAMLRDDKIVATKHLNTLRGYILDTEHPS
jgi:hypothetical protein